jgi:hypothetical protein
MYSMHLYRPAWIGDLNHQQNIVNCFHLLAAGTKRNSFVAGELDAVSLIMSPRSGNLNGA